VQIAVVTSDDRAPTVAALTWFEVLDQVAFIACADDGYPYKPAPEAVWAACKATGIAPERTVMVGDSTTDMLMAQRAGLGLRVAVLTGTMDTTVLAPLADIVLESIGEIRVDG
jgi:phosphoglycolate phosphatase-like HAD superfamily hydrolase